MQIHHLRSATLLLSIGPHRILVDPMLSAPGTLPGFKLFGGGRRKNPLVPLPASTNELLAQTTCVLVTHEHPDHLDGAAVAWIAARKLPVFASPTDVPSLRKKGLTAQVFRTGSLGLAVELVPSRHGLGLLGWLMGPVAGFYLAHPDEPSVYLTGDAVMSDGVVDALSRLRPDVVIAPAGAANFGLGPNILFSIDELMGLVRLAPGRLLFNHLESLDHCPTTRKVLRDRLEKEGLADRVHIPADGEMVSFATSGQASHAQPGPYPERIHRLQKWVSGLLG